MTAGRRINSLSQHWCTPRKYVDAVRGMFGGDISLDPCSNAWSIINAKTEYCLPQHDGLRATWNFPTIYVNPPYGADRQRRTTIRHWLSKCVEAHKRFASEVLALIPVAANTGHWKRCIWGKATAVCFLYDTRLRFLVNGRDEGKGAPMACAMVYWGADYERFVEVFMQFGAVVDLRPLQGARIGQRERALELALFEHD